MGVWQTCLCSFVQCASSDRKQLTHGQRSSSQPVCRALVSGFSIQSPAYQRHSMERDAACASLSCPSQRQTAADWQAAASAEAAVSVQRLLSGGGPDLDVASCGMFVPSDARPAAAWLSAAIQRPSSRLLSAQCAPADAQARQVHAWHDLLHKSDILESGLCCRSSLASIRIIKNSSTCLTTSGLRLKTTPAAGKLAGPTSYCQLWQRLLPPAAADSKAARWVASCVSVSLCFMAFLAVASTWGHNSMFHTPGNPCASLAALPTDSPTCLECCRKADCTQITNLPAGQRSGSC
jgi:hypothetical protein